MEESWRVYHYSSSIAKRLTVTRDGLIWREGETRNIKKGEYYQAYGTTIYKAPRDLDTHTWLHMIPVGLEDFKL